MLELKDILCLMEAFAASHAGEMVLEVAGARLALSKGTAQEPAVELPDRQRSAPGLATMNASGHTPPTVSAMQVVSAAGGVFYRAAAPDDPPFVQAGDLVQAKQVIGLVEVMKMQMEIRSPAAGVIGEWLVSNGDVVTPQQPLVSLEVGAIVGT